MDADEAWRRGSNFEFSRFKALRRALNESRIRAFLNLYAATFLEMQALLFTREIHPLNSKTSGLPLEKFLLFTGI
jgi:hypothetical protein